MRWTLVPLLLLGIRGAQAAEDDQIPRERLTVRASTGSYTGLQNPEYANVREFRNIPYAYPPTGPRRWRPPVPVPSSRRHHYARRFAPPCQQYSSGNPSLWNSNMTDTQIRLDGQSYTAGQSSQTSSEDCLSVAIWTPLNVTRDARLPVAVFVPGGSFTVGGINIPYQNPAPWVSRSQAHIVVIVAYRLGIFGYPNAAALAGRADGEGDDGDESNNVGLLDVRAGLEWVYANIEAFGGNRDRIMLWGHSAGAVAVDAVAYAYHEDVLASSLFMMSGSAMAPGPGADPAYSNFTFVAKNLGCDFPDEPGAELACMRQVPATLITNFVGKYADNRTEPILSFKPKPDEKIVFSNYTARTLQGKIARVPAIVSTTTNEQSSLIRYPEADLQAGPNKTEVDKGNVGFVCMVRNTTDVRAAQGVPTYRYQFAGVYSSLGPLPWMGSFHGIDIPLVFGTFARRARDPGGGGASFPEQVKVSETLQDHLLAFVADPAEGLVRRGWPPQLARVDEGGTMMRFAWRGRIEANISSLEVDDACLGKIPYNSDP